MADTYTQEGTSTFSLDGVTSSSSVFDMYVQVSGSQKKVQSAYVQVDGDIKEITGIATQVDGSVKES